MNLTALTKLAVKPAGKLAIESVKFVTGLSALLSPFRLLIVIIFGFFFFHLVIFDGPSPAPGQFPDISQEKLTVQLVRITNHLAIFAFVVESGRVAGDGRATCRSVQTSSEIPPQQTQKIGLKLVSH